jgi:hypothetical protein
MLYMQHRRQEEMFERCDALRRGWFCALGVGSGLVSSQHDVAYASHTCDALKLENLPYLTDALERRLYVVRTFGQVAKELRESLAHRG